MRRRGVEETPFFFFQKLERRLGLWSSEGSFFSVCASLPSRSLGIPPSGPPSLVFASLYSMRGLRLGLPHPRMALLVAFVLGLLACSSMASSDFSTGRFVLQGTLLIEYEQRILE